MVTNKQVKKYRDLVTLGQVTREVAAMKAGMTAKTARKWETGPMPSEKPICVRPLRTWRTREDPLKGHWEEVVVPELAADKEGVFDAKFLFEYLQETRPDQVADSLLRTFQRRVCDYRVLQGQPKEVMFPQVYRPGEKAQLDFTRLKSLGITVGGEPINSLLFECVLCYSGQRSVSLVPSESYEALITGVQVAFTAWGGCPAELWHDHMSAAIHNLKAEERYEINQRYQQRLEYYGVTARFIEVAKPNQNGCVERSHGVLKSLLKQALKLRRNSDFHTVEDFVAFVDRMVERLNRKRTERWAEERAVLRPLPATMLPTYSEQTARVSKWSLIQVKKNTYSVPSQLIDHEVRLRIHLESIQVYYKDKLMDTLPRRLGTGGVVLNYRHIIDSLIRKPGAFASYRYREELFPSLTFRQAYDRLVKEKAGRADLEYLRILHLAARNMQSDVESALELYLGTGEPLCSDAIKELVAPRASADLVELPAPAPEFAHYDSLLTGELCGQLTHR